MMLDLHDLAIVRFKEMHDGRTEILAGDVACPERRRLRDRILLPGGKPVIADGIGRLRTRHSNAKGKLPVSAGKHSAVEGAIKHVVAVEKAGNVRGRWAAVNLVGLAKLP